MISSACCQTALKRWISWPQLKNSKSGRRSIRSEGHVELVYTNCDAWYNEEATPLKKRRLVRPDAKTERSTFLSVFCSDRVKMPPIGIRIFEARAIDTNGKQ
jgi:hypothetical protein